MDMTVGARTVLDTAAGGTPPRLDALPALGEVRLRTLPDGLARLARPIVLTGRLETVASEGRLGRLATVAGTVTLELPPGIRPGEALVLRIAPGAPPERASLYRAGPAAGSGDDGDLAAGSGAATGPANPPVAEAEDAFVARLPQVTPPVAPETGLLPGTVFLARREASGAGTAGPCATIQRYRLLAATVPTRAALPAPGDDLGPRAAAFGVRLWQTRVTGRTDAGALGVCDAEGSLWRLDLRAAPPSGTVLTALALGAAPESSAQGGGSGGDALLTVRQALLALASLDRPTAASLLETVVPQPTGRLAASLAFTIGQVLAGDARGWLGEVASTLLERHGHADLLADLGDDFREQARRWAETPPEDWRSLVLPVFDGALLGVAHLHAKALPGEAPEPGRTRAVASGHRFLIDLEMSRLGALQLDGLVKARRFNLLVRSHNPLPAPVRLQLQESFAEALRVIDYQGGLGFRVGAQALVSVAAEDRRAGGLGVVV